MKQLLLFTLALLFSLNGLAQAFEEDAPKTLAGNNFHNGGYGAVMFHGTTFNGKFLPMAGLRGAWVINRALGIGLDMQGFIPSEVYRVDVREGFFRGEQDARLAGGYGGLLLEPVIFSNNVVHATFPLSAGAGWAGYLSDFLSDDYFYHHGEIYDQSTFWYFRPGAAVEINVASFFRINLGVSYMMATNFELISTSSNALNNFQYSLGLKFGGF
ncbi:hypothetical protein [Persicobacter diffluens]|uniref:Outer membrane protein beta-barrel domain-containing protein n=1 Tax=Persicobacter diffluens TaxID=981 RepID=A0AAN4VY43_9BACT|nr:hypothetical protein PEDI_19360 [Persicobacter diffluens]